CKSTKTTIGAGNDALFVSDCGHRLAQALSHYLRVLDEICRGIEHAGDQQHVCRQRMLFERLVLVLMTWIGELDRQGADVRAMELGQELRQGDVADVRAIVIAPADMQTDTVAWNAGKTLIDRRDMPLELLQERPLIEMRKEAGALHRQVGCIDLQHMPRLVNR